MSRPVPPYTICADTWNDSPCRYAVKPIEHVCIRLPDHRGPHQCSCGSVRQMAVA